MVSVTELLEQMNQPAGVGRHRISVYCQDVPATAAAVATSLEWLRSRFAGVEFQGAYTRGRWRAADSELAESEFLGTLLEGRLDGDFLYLLSDPSLRVPEEEARLGIPTFGYNSFGLNFYLGVDYEGDLAGQSDELLELGLGLLEASDADVLAIYGSASRLIPDFDGPYSLVDVPWTLGFKDRAAVVPSLDPLIDAGGHLVATGRHRVVSYSSGMLAPLGQRDAMLEVAEPLLTTAGQRVPGFAWGILFLPTAFGGVELPAEMWSDAGSEGE